VTGVNRSGVPPQTGHGKREATFQSLVTVKICAGRLCMSEKAIRLWLARGLLPRVKLGRSVRIPLEALESFIKENTLPARRLR
jgi:excisionase family DNA binding protein